MFRAASGCLLLTLGHVGLGQTEVYKCTDANGAMTFQATPCSVEQEQAVAIQSRSAEAGQQTVTAGSGVIGSWVVKDKPLLTAYLSVSGSFSMSDHTGAKARGKWSKNEAESYRVEANFMGMNFPISMSYDADNDQLLLSKPGFPDSKRRYQRK